MAYLSLETVKSAFIRNADKISSPDWGILTILYTLGEEVVPTQSYCVDKDILGDKLNQLFSFPGKPIKSNSTIYVTFSAQWSKLFFETLGDNVSVLDMAIWFYRKTLLPDTISKGQLIDKFLSDLHIPLKVISEFCDMSSDNAKLDLSESLYSDNQLLKDIQSHFGFQIVDNAITLKAEGKGMAVKTAADFGAAPFTQPLYASKGYSTILLLTDFPLSELYSKSMSEMLGTDNVDNINLEEERKKVFLKYFAAYLRLSTGKSSPEKLDLYLSLVEKQVNIPIRSKYPEYTSIFSLGSTSTLAGFLDQISKELPDLAILKDDVWPKDDKEKQTIYYEPWTFVRHYRNFLELASEVDSINVKKNYLTRSSNQELFEDKWDNTVSKFTGEVSPIILYGPPGTGKTHSLQENYMRKFDKELVYFTTFHQSFSYEEFVEGLKPILAGKSDKSDIQYEIEKGVFFRACETAAKLAGYDSLKDCINDTEANREVNFKDAVSKRKLVLLCIDEINRGNVASIFGDLISLIEPSKRLGNKDELILTLPYSKERFGVPANLVIVGTMNTSDRSIQLLDSALRRRFQFEELLPNYGVIKNDFARNILKSINSRVRALINKDSQIGHAYFFDIPAQGENVSQLILKAIVNKIIPLLEEYFYNDHSKVRFVLSDTDILDSPFYVKDEAASNVYSEYAQKEDLDETMDFYELNPEIEDGVKNEVVAESFLNRWK